MRISLVITVLLMVSAFLGADEKALVPLVSGRLDLVLEDALPFAPPNAGDHPHQDLHVSLDVSDGVIDPTGWAWIPAMAGMEHRCVVTTATVDATTIHLDLRVAVAHQLPRLAGGSIRATIDLVRDGERFRGSFHCESTVTEERDLRTLRRRHPLADGLRSGITTSLLRVADGVQPIVVSGHLVPVLAGHGPAAHPRCPAGLDPAQGRALLDAAAGGALRRLLVEWAAAAADAIDNLLARCVLAWVDGADGPAREHLALELPRLLAVVPDQRGDAWAGALRRSALAYDLLAGDLPPEVRRECAHRLLDAACAGAGLREDQAIFADDGAVGWPANERDPRLVASRSVVGIAALVLQGDPAVAADRQDDLDAVLKIAERSLERYGRTAIGPAGSGPGTIAARLAEDHLARYYAVRQLVTGRPPPLPGLAGLARWHLRAACLTRAAGPVDAGGDWLAAAGLLAPPEDLPGLAWWRAAHPAEPTDALGVLLELVLASRLPEPAAPQWCLPEHDETMGAVVFREGWDPAAFVLHLESGGPYPEDGPGCGRFGIVGRGREWVCEPRRPAADAIAAVAGENVLQIRRGASANLRALWPAQGGNLFRLFARRDGAGSAGIIAAPYLDADPRTGAVAVVEATKTSWHWRTVGVDYGGKSGAPFLAVLVDGSYGTEPRNRVWTLHLGDIPQERVRLEAQRFEVRPAGSGDWLRGVLLFPGTVTLKYVAGEDGVDARIEAWLAAPEVPDEVLTGESFDQLNRAILYGRGTVRSQAEDWSELDLRSPDDVVRLQRWERSVMRKIQRVTTSTSMGAPTLGQRVRNHAVAVLTIGPGTHPALSIPGPDDPDLVVIGDRRVRYHEFLVEFLDLEPAVAE